MQTFFSQRGSKQVNGMDFNAVIVHLFKNDVKITKDTLVTDLVEADFVGYAAQNKNQLDEGQLSDGYWQGAEDATFTAGAILAAQTIYGAWFIATGFGFLGAVRFDRPARILANGNIIVVHHPLLIVRSWISAGPVTGTHV